MRPITNPTEVTNSPPDLNTQGNEAKSALQLLIAHDDLQEIRAENDRKRKAGQDIREGLSKMKSMRSAGQLITLGGMFEIGKSLLDEVEKG